MLRRLIVLAAVAAALAHATDARACGCFALGSTATPVVQAGERILFSHDGDNVVAYIQIKYQGQADEFGWLVPLPSVPTLELGTDELFTMLDSATLPKYVTQNVVENCDGTVSSGSGCNFNLGGSAPSSGGDFFESDMGVAASFDMGTGGLVVAQASLGPYDYAVLKADDESAMLQWLDDNHYFVPTGTMTAIAPYIHPGGYFLALKLRGGEPTGAITPIVLSYASDLPMIPITLTQVSAIDNMGVEVWVAGEARAVPHNYYHVVLDDMPVWFNTASYNAQLIEAVHEAPGKHGFITQYAGSSAVARNRLVYPGRFGDLATLRLQATPSAYLHYLRDNGYAFDGTLLSILSGAIPEPAALVAAGVPLAQFYANYDSYASTGGPDADGGADTTPFDPNALTDEIDMRIVTPTKDANAIFTQHPYLTRLYTALSPADMTIDPVFSTNADLGDVPLTHSATLTTPCIGKPWLSTGDGFQVQYDNGLPPNLNLPASLRVELVRDAGPAELVQDNTAAIEAALGPVDYGRATSNSSSGCGCTVGRRRVHTNVAMIFAAAAMLLLARALRRRRV
ncbi:MAG TPA: DUF2330 domain-containing protein [Polyangia bacterium]|jgi:hypothetical protein